MKYYWFSTKRMTVGVYVNNGIISDGPPIVRKFIGQPLDSLRRWLSQQEGFSEEILNNRVQNVV